ncbi:histone deacetylase [Algoriphagus sp. CAU 1675]|uniref:histone deacetylase family protein n=1 Tax=Algoriphagus sp. CAU 1675 TaxID=3032597 RepID=UPI0023DBBAF3|nr:histone deacetylase [Algoriphagus sp. CAU 1675]MDF2157754.1 histone deacetylase [Algoriphagus sp. CAU 1675]
MLKIAWSPLYAHSLPKGHRFPMEKYELLPVQLMHEGTVDHSNFFTPTKVPEELVTKTHDPVYWEKLKNLTLSKSEIRATGFPLSRELVERELIIAGGSIQAAEFALDHGIAMNIAGGTHHAFANRGEGFCLLNDIALTANYLQAKGLAQNILVVDLDVHQGNGTAAIFQGRHDVFTFSMHGEKNYPYRKEFSSLDVALPDGIRDKEYLYLLKKYLDEILEGFDPDFIIYQSGVDVLESDQLGRLSLTMEGVRQRDKTVLDLGAELNVPIMCCMGGGYSKKISQIIEAHAQVYRLAQELFF